MNKIPYEERCEVYEAAVAKWGEEMQMLVAIEEMSEVVKALTKWLRGTGTKDDVAEEIADATIMLEQLRLIFGINEEVCEAMDAKIERLRERMNR